MRRCQTCDARGVHDVACKDGDKNVRRSAADVSCTQRAGGRRCACSPAQITRCNCCSLGAAGTLQSARRPICAQMQRKRPCGMNHRVRSANDLSRRAAMDQGRLGRFRSQLASRAGGSREASRQSIDREASHVVPRLGHALYHTTTSNGQHYVLTNSWVRPMRRRGRGGGGGWEVLVV